MEKIKIGAKALAVLQSFGKINPLQKITSEMLYANGEAEGQASGLVGVYKVPENEIVSPAFGVRSVPEFINVTKMVKDGEMFMDGLLITVKDATKKVSYNTTPSDMIDDMPTTGQELYSASNDVIVTFALDESTIKDVNDTINKMSLDKLEIVVDSEGTPTLYAHSTSTNDSVTFKLDGKGVEDTTLVFGSPTVLSYLLTGIYAVQVRDLGPDTGNVKAAKLVNKSLGDKETNGELYYFYVLE